MTAATEYIDVGVVIVTYNSADHVVALIDSIDAACAGLTWRAVVVDNASIDETVELSSKAGVEVIELDRNRGYSAALNVGIESIGEVSSVLVANPDIVLYPGSLGPAFAELQEAGVGIVSPQLRTFGGDLAATQRRDPTVGRMLGLLLLGTQLASRNKRLSEAVTNRRVYLVRENVDWAVGALLLISRQCLQDVGSWDESFFLYSEETDYCCRARRAGFVVRYLPVAAGRHRGGGGVEDPHLRSMMELNKVRHYARHHSRVSGYVFMALMVAYEATRAASGNRAAKSALRALVFPSRRPTEIKCSESFLPR